MEGNKGARCWCCVQVNSINRIHPINIKLMIQFFVFSSINRDRYTYIVCNYDPCGNTAGEFAENVPKLVSQSDAPYLSIDQRCKKLRGFNEDGTRLRIQPKGVTFEEQCLNSHNRYRALHDCPPLKLNGALNEYAAEWAKV